MDKTHFRKAFNSPYLSSADIVGEATLTIANVTLEKDKTKKTGDQFNTAHFAEKEIRPVDDVRHGGGRRNSTPTVAGKRTANPAGDGALQVREQNQGDSARGQQPSRHHK